MTNYYQTKTKPSLNKVVAKIKSIDNRLETVETKVDAQSKQTMLTCYSSCFYETCPFFVIKLVFKLCMSQCVDKEV